MGHWLDSVARAMARKATPKDFLKLVGATVVGAAIAHPPVSEAKPERVCNQCQGPSDSRCCLNSINELTCCKKPRKCLGGRCCIPEKQCNGGTICCGKDPDCG